MAPFAGARAGCFRQPLSRRLLGGDDRIGLLVDQLQVEPLSAAHLRVSFSGGDDMQTSICIASNDPDEPLQYVALTSGNQDSNPSLGAMATDFVLTGLDGQTYQLSQQLGHPVVLVYFATW